MGQLLHDPVGNRIELIESGAGMGIEFENSPLASPDLLHAGHAFEYEANIPLHGSVDVIKGLYDIVHVPGLVDHLNLADLFRLGLLIESYEYGAASPLTASEAVKDSQVGAFS